MFIFKNLVTYICLLFLIGCSTVDKTLDYFSLDKEEEKLEGKRLDIIRLKDDLLVDQDAKEVPITFSASISNLSWDQFAYLSTNESGHFSIAENPNYFWKKRIGDGEGKYNTIYAQPVGNSSTLFALDAEGKLVALDIENGDIIWELNVFPESESLNTSIDGGLALKEDNLIISNSYGDIINVNTLDGKIRWKINNNKPAQGPPALYEDFLFQMTIHNELFVYNINTGDEVWRYVSSFVSAISNGGTSVAVNSKAVIFPSNTGELFALNLSTGSLIWNSNLVMEGTLSGTLELTDIDSGPVIHNDLIFAASLSGVFAAIDVLSGLVVWDIFVKTSSNPLVNGNAVFVISDDGKLINILRNSGKIRWITNIIDYLEVDTKNQAICRGPILASNSLWLVCQNKTIFQVDAYTGIVKNSFILDSPSNIAPIVIKDTLVFFTEDAEIITYR